LKGNSILLVACTRVSAQIGAVCPGNFVTSAQCLVRTRANRWRECWRKSVITCMMTLHCMLMRHSCHG